MSSRRLSDSIKIGDIVQRPNGQKGVVKAIANGWIAILMLEGFIMNVKLEFINAYKLIK